MAEIHKKGDGKETTNSDIPVVAPINMGKGIKWNANTKQYDVSIAENQPIHVNDNGDLEVRVSNLEDNLLRVIDGKLYYGTKARTELANLYVDAVNGVDQDPLKVKGAGTRANPLRTFKYACDLSERYTNRTIHLHEKQEHIVSVDAPVSIKSGRLTLTCYGPERDNLLATLPNGTKVHEAMGADDKLPYLRFKGVSSNQDRAGHQFISFACVRAEKDSYIQTEGVSLYNDLDVDVGQYTTSTSYNFAAAARIVLNQSEFYFSRGNLKSSGMIKNTGNITQLKDGINIVGFLYPISSKINIYYTTNVEMLKTLGCSIISPSGSQTAMSSSNALSCGQPAIFEDVAKRILAVRKQDIAGTQVVIAPTTDIPSQYFP